MTGMISHWFLWFDAQDVAETHTRILNIHFDYEMIQNTVFNFGGLPWIHLPMQEIWVWSLGWEDSLENEMVTHSSILAWETPWTEDPGGLQSIGSQKSQTQLSD